MVSSKTKLCSEILGLKEGGGGEWGRLELYLVAWDAARCTMKVKRVLRIFLLPGPALPL